MKVAIQWKLNRCSDAIRQRFPMKFEHNFFQPRVGNINLFALWLLKSLRIRCAWEVSLKPGPQPKLTANWSCRKYPIEARQYLFFADIFLRISLICKLPTKIQFASFFLMCAEERESKEILFRRVAMRNEMRGGGGGLASLWLNRFFCQRRKFYFRKPYNRFSSTWSNYRLSIFLVSAKSLSAHSPNV